MIETELTRSETELRNFRQRELLRLRSEEAERDAIDSVRSALSRKKAMLFDHFAGIAESFSRH